MEVHQKPKVWLVTGIIILLLTAACSTPVAETAVPANGPPTAAAKIIDSTVLASSDVAAVSLVTVQTEAGTRLVKELMTCMAQEPESLYIYSGNPRRDLGARSASILQPALYEPMAVMIAGQYEARGLTHIPTRENGGVIIDMVTVQAGDWVVNAHGEVVQLVDGTPLHTLEGELFEFEGTAVSLPQMHVTFTLQPFVWSDGTAVTAEDSVFSYQIAAAPATPMPKTRVQRTASYQATGPHTVEWIGVPGNITDDYVQNIWTPLPKHQLGQYSAAELLTLDLTTRMPLSYGRFVIEAWEPGSHISLISNPYYYALDKNAPIQRIVYEFLEPEADF